MKNHNLVYRITNNLNGKYYIGIHSTDDINDGYMGSGNLIKKSITKEGISNFTKQILFDYKHRKAALKKEKQLVDKNQVKSAQCYNLVLGGGSPINIKPRTKQETIPKAPKFARYDEEYRYVFKSRNVNLAAYQEQISAISDCFYKLVSQTFIDNHENACKLLTETFNNKYTNKDARSIIKVYEDKNLAQNFIVTKELWLTN